MSRTNETRYVGCHKTSRSKCRLNASVYNNNTQRWNKDKCRCECKEYICKGICGIGFIWNHSICECECDKLCDIGQYFDNENFKCRNKLIDKLVKGCSEHLDGIKMIHNDYRNVCNSCT